MIHKMEERRGILFVPQKSCESWKSRFLEASEKMPFRACAFPKSEIDEARGDRLRAQ